jgi:glycine C-acetyltransferase
LEDLKAKGLFNTIDVLEGSNGPIITVNDQKMINLASNNYLGFATRPEMIRSRQEATKHYGAGAGAVRTINGTLDIHQKLEEKIAELKERKQRSLSNLVSTVTWVPFSRMKKGMRFYQMN